MLFHTAMFFHIIAALFIKVGMLASKYITTTDKGIIGC